MPSDARNYASTLLSDHRSRDAHGTVFCYGAADRVVIGTGAARWIQYAAGVVSASHLDSGVPAVGLEDVLNSFLDNTSGQWVMGYIGFGVHARRCGSLALGHDPDLFLFAPQEATVVSADGLWQSGRRAGRIPPAPPDTPVPPPELGGPCREEFGSMVDDVLSWIADGPGRRLTVATRHEWSAQVDLVATMAAGQQDDHGLSRSFYLLHEGMEFAGTSPELLADGRWERFVCHKLSATLPLPGPDANSRWDERLIREHETAIDALTANLSGHAAVARGSRQTLRVMELEHGMTQLTVEPKPDHEPGSILLDLVPTGASPPGPGLRQIGKVERHPRGPYYGLVGCIAPDGQMNWSQLLRTVFARQDQVWIPVGAAVTPMSTAALEVQEIAAKASTVRLVSRR
ncbi:chorismate-binding protein [Streptomyces albus]|uniref:chorismate-binding protein n=1 Tax=Streptomyces albus TaxID=1888 RepID=UPI0033E7D263